MFLYIFNKRHSVRPTPSAFLLYKRIKEINGLRVLTKHGYGNEPDLREMRAVWYRRGYMSIDWLKSWVVRDAPSGGYGDGDNIAFIDGQNVHLGTAGGGWKIDTKRFRVYLREKYRVREAQYWFGCYMKEQKELYKNLKRFGYKVCFKDAYRDQQTSEKKGNVDSDIIFEAARLIMDGVDFDKIVIVSSDGDYKKLIDYLIKRGKFEKILFPSKKNTSSLYRSLSRRYFTYLDAIKSSIEYRKRNSP